MKVTKLHEELNDIQRRLKELDQKVKDIDQKITDVEAELKLRKANTDEITIIRDTYNVVTADEE